MDLYGSWQPNDESQKQAYKFKDENPGLSNEHEAALKCSSTENPKEQESTKSSDTPSLEEEEQKVDQKPELVEMINESKQKDADDLQHIDKQINKNIKEMTPQPSEALTENEGQLQEDDKMALETNERQQEINEIKDTEDINQVAKCWMKDQFEKLEQVSQPSNDEQVTEEIDDWNAESFDMITCPNSLSSCSTEGGAMARMTLSFCNLEKEDESDVEEELEEERANEQPVQDKPENETVVEIKQLNDKSRAHKTAGYDLTISLHDKIMDDFEKKRLAVEEAFSCWYPSGISLIKQLRESADKLDTNQKGSSIAGLVGGVTGLVGAAMTLFPPTLPFGVAIGLTGAATGLGASGANYVASNYIEKFVNNMIKDQESGYIQLTEATDDFKSCVLEHYEYLDEYCSGGITEIIRKKNSEDDNDRVLCDAGRAVIAVANAERLARVAPYLKYAGMSNKAVKAAMVKDAVHLAHLSKFSGKALRASEISKATHAFKVAKQGVKIGAQGVAIAAFGAAIAIVDIMINVKDLANGSLVAKAEDYRAMADKMEIMLQDITLLMSKQNPNTPSSKI